MQENYLISIVGTQEIDGEKDQIELTTVGTYVRKGNSRYIVYHEFNQDLPAGKDTSVLKVEDDKRVTLIRSVWCWKRASAIYVTTTPASAP